MADNLEMRVDQLTSAIRGLYDKPTATVNDINSAINSIGQRLENINNVSREQLGQILTGDIRRLLDERHAYLQEHLLGFENTLRQMAASAGDQKLSLEIARVVSDLSSVYTKLNAQESLLVNISKAVDSGSREELEKLKNEFATFSRGFDSITQSLNKNFSDFLLQIQTYSSKEDFKKLFVDMDNVQNNTNAIISALAIIDHKYKDLTGLIDLVTKKENTFSQGLEELRKSIQSVEGMSGAIRAASTKDDIGFLDEKIAAVSSFLNNIRTLMETMDAENKTRLSEFVFAMESKLGAIQTNNDFDRLKEEMRNSYTELKEDSRYVKEELLAQFKEVFSALSASGDSTKETFVLESGHLRKNLETLSEEMLKLQNFVSQNLDIKTDEMRLDIKSLMGEFERAKSSIGEGPSNNNIEGLMRLNDENFIKMYDLIHEQLVNLDGSIESRASSNKNALADTISDLQGEVKSLMTGLINLKNDMGEATRQNLEILRGPIEKALSNIENLTIGNELKQLSIAVDQTVTDIKKSFETMKENFAEIATNSNIQVLQQLNSSIPTISDKLEIFRTHVVSENSAHIKELKQHFNEVIETIKSNVQDITSSLKADFSNVNEEISQTLRIDLQKMSDHLIESVEGVNLNISQEFNDHKVNIDELLVRIQDYEEKFREKLDSLETTFEGLNQDTCDRVAQAINANNQQYQQAINIVKKEILSHITGLGEHNKAGMAELKLKVDQLIDSGSLNSLASIGGEDKSSLSSIENKLERTNLQQIHNAKELMEEIQSLNSELTFKIDSLLDPDNFGRISKTLAKLEDKVQNSTDIDELAKITKNHIDLRAKELLQKISKFEDITSIKSARAEDVVDEEIASSSKINELVSGIEFIGKNIFEELKESFARQNKILEEVQGADGKEAAKQLHSELENAVNELKNEIAQKVNEAKLNPDELVKRTNAELEHILKNINVDPEEIAKRVSADTENVLRNLGEEVKRAIGENALNQDELVDKIKSVVSKLEAPAPVVVEKGTVQDINVTAEIPKSLEDRIGNIETLARELSAAMGKLQKSGEEQGKYTYTMEDIESDLAKIRLSIEKANVGAPTAVKAEGAAPIDYRGSLDDIRTRLANVQKMTSSHAAEIVSQIAKKITSQEGRFDALEGKLNSVVQKQSEEFDIKAFIDVFYENTTQTRSLAARVESMENQLAAISKNMQKIVSYIEE